MASPTSRLLELLELLQARPLTTGREIADRLEIDARTVRRYIERAAGPRDPGRGAARRRRRVPDPAGVPAATADARRRGGGRRRARPPRDARPTRRLVGRRRRRAGEDQPRAAVDAPPSGRGARGDARLHGHDARRPCRRRRRAPARRRDPSPAPGQHRLPHVRRGGDGARAQPARPRRPLGTLVPRRPRSPARRPAHVPGRPDVAHGARRRRAAFRRRRDSTPSRT